MQLRVYTEEQCPHCGRTESSERVRRSQVIRLLLPNTKLMKCRLCLSRFLVRHFND